MEVPRREMRNSLQKQLTFLEQEPRLELKRKKRAVLTFATPELIQRAVPNIKQVLVPTLHNTEKNITDGTWLPVHGQAARAVLGRQD